MQQFTNISPETIELFEGEGYENRPMWPKEIAQRLDAHGTYHTLIAGHIYVQNGMGIFTINTHNWTLFDLLDYLNY